MLKWALFAIVSLGWLGTCWFFGSMVALTNAGPKASIAKDACANRRMAEAKANGIVLDRMTALNLPECRAAHDAVFRVEAAPAKRKGLLIGLLPILIVGGLMIVSSRRG